jgi:predicted nucleotidyltransferase
VQTPVERLSEQLSVQWRNIAEARRRTEAMKAKLATLSDFSSEDASLIVFGSIGRGEVTEESDVDWTLLIDGPSDPHHTHAVARVRERLHSLGLELPGRTETFGVMAFSHDLIHHIAGPHDTNQNLTRRVLLLFESVAITEPLVRERVIGNVVDRYVRHDVIAPRPTPPRRVVAHFLLNDVVRYWRTMAGDYAAKMWERQNEGWGLRNVKLRFSRKLIFVAGLLACFSFVLDPPADADSIRANPAALQDALATHVLSRLAMSPLDALAAALIAHSPESISRSLFDAYDRFLGILLDPEKRAELSHLRIDKALDSAVWLEAREASHEFRKSLEALFLERPGVLRELTLSFGVF